MTRFTRQIGVIFACAVATLVARSASAQPRGETTRWRSIEVGSPQLFDLQLLEGAPFALPAAGGSARDDLSVAEVQRVFAKRRVQIQDQIVVSLRRLDLVTVHDDAVLRQKIAGDETLEAQARLASERLDLGRERWLGLESEAALEQFDKARELLLGAWMDIIVPERFAEAEFQRGLALAELGREPEATAAFRAMFVYDPSRRLTEGWYGARIDRLLLAAASDARALSNPINARFPAERLKGLAERTGLSHWLVGVVTAGNGGGSGASLAVEVLTFDAASPRGLSRAAAFSLGSTAADGPSIGDLPRWLAAWHTCALDFDLAPLAWRPAPRRTLFLDLAYRHSVWLNHRQTRLFLHGPGFQLGLTWEPAPLIQLWARLSQASTLVDSRGDLLNEFGTTHIALGGALRVGSEAFTAALRFGFDAALSLNDFEATFDIDCKFFGADSPRCGRVFSAAAPLVWFGFDAGLAFRWRPHASWYLSFAAGVSVYVVEPDAARELNYPLHGSLGVGAAF